jgi:hypothetical protein
MEDVSLLFVNSKNRDKTLYPSGNSYTLHLTTPIRNITRIDLVSVKIPNTTYNLTATSNIVINTTTNVSMLPGYYTTASFTTEFNSSNQTSVRVNYSTAEGRFLFYGSSLSSLSATGQLSNIIGITTASSFAASSNPAYASNTAYSGMNLVKSANVVDTSTNDYVWLDIDELRTPISIDAKSLVSMPTGGPSAETGISTFLQTYQGLTSSTSFAMITMDVPNGEIKTFKEKTDYLISNKYPSRIDNLTRLTIKWLDINGLPISFNGLENNSFILRIHSLRYLPEKDRQMTLPAPVDMSTGVPQRQRMIAITAILILILGLLVIVFYKPIVADDV